MKQASWHYCVVSLSLVFASLSAGGAHAEKAPPACNYVNTRVLPIEFSGIRPTIDGSINGNTTRMLVDTGSDSTVLLRSAVEKFGLPTRRQGEMTSVGTNGISDVYEVRIKDFRIASIDANTGNMVVVWHSSLKLPYDALVGADFLFGQDLEIYLAQQYMKSFRPAGGFLSPFSCRRTFLAYWDANASVVDLKTMSPDDIRPVVTVEVNGRKMRAMIDTGSSVSVISPHAAARAGVTPRSPGVQEGGYFAGIGSSQPNSWLAPFDSFTLGDETIRNAKLYVIDMWGAADAERARSYDRRERPEILLGADFLKAHRVLFAMSQRRFYFSYVGGEVFGGVPQLLRRNDVAREQPFAASDS